MKNGICLVLIFFGLCSFNTAMATKYYTYIANDDSYYSTSMNVEYTVCGMAVNNHPNCEPNKSASIKKNKPLLIQLENPNDVLYVLKASLLDDDLYEQVAVSDYTTSYNNNTSNIVSRCAANVGKFIVLSSHKTEMIGCTITNG